MHGVEVLGERQRLRCLRLCRLADHEGGKEAGRRPFEQLVHQRGHQGQNRSGDLLADRPLPVHDSVPLPHVPAIPLRTLTRLGHPEGRLPGVVQEGLEGHHRVRRAPAHVQGGRRLVEEDPMDVMANHQRNLYHVGGVRLPVGFTALASVALGHLQGLGHDLDQ